MGLTANLKRGSIPPLLLTLLRAREMYGYEIAQQLERLDDRSLGISQGTLYPTLHRLESDGLVEGVWRQRDAGRRRRYYRLTAKGRRAAEEAEADLRRYATVILRALPEAT